MKCSRRALLKAGGLAGAAVCLGLGAARGGAAPGSDAAPRSDAAPGSDAARTAGTLKRVALQNLHTGERLDIEYFREGAYLPSALSAIEVLLRDFRSGERHAIDPHLMDYLVQVAQELGVDPAFSVISGYRSPTTNAQLRERARESHSAACTWKGEPSTCA